MKWNYRLLLVGSVGTFRFCSVTAERSFSWHTQHRLPCCAVAQVQQPAFSSKNVQN
jgi:hypothetical protein